MKRTRQKPPDGPTLPSVLTTASETPREPATHPHDHAARETSSGTVDCTFCGKTQREVKKLVSGPYIGRRLITICDECIAIAASLTTDEEAASETSAPKDIARPEPDLRVLCPLLFSTPSARLTPIAEQCAARGEEVPVGQTAGVLRALGFEVPADIEDSARLIASDSPNASIVSIGKLTGYAWKRDAYESLMWLHDHREMLRAIPHDCLAAHYAELRRFMRLEWSEDKATSEALAVTTASVMLMIYGEARRRETVLAEDARRESLAAPVATPLDAVAATIFEGLWSTRGRAVIGLRVEPGYATLTVTIAFARGDVPDIVARLARRDADLSAELAVERATLAADEDSLDVVMSRDGRHIREAVTRLARYLASRAAPTPA